MITFQQQETTEIRNRNIAAWATFHKYRQEFTSKTYTLRHRLRLFDAVVSPTMKLRLWNLDPLQPSMKEWFNQRNVKMLLLIIQKKGDTKRLRNEKTRPMKTTTQKTWVALKKKMSMDTVQNTCYDQDSDISFKHDADEEIDTTALEEEEWIEYIKRSTDEANEKMKNAKSRCWIKTHKRVKWRLALRIASLPSERWIVKAGWNPELSSRHKTYRATGRPRRR